MTEIWRRGSAVVARAECQQHPRPRSVDHQNPVLHLRLVQLVLRSDAQADARWVAPLRRRRLPEGRGHAVLFRREESEITDGGLPQLGRYVDQVTETGLDHHPAHVWERHARARHEKIPATSRICCSSSAVESIPAGRYTSSKKVEDKFVCRAANRLFKEALVWLTSLCAGSEALDCTKNERRG